MRKRTVIASFTVILALSLLVACGTGAINAVKNTEIKTLFEKSGKTYGEVLDKYCSSTKWRTFESGYLTIIEFSGKTPDGKSVVIQWLDKPDADHNVCWAWSLDGKEQDIVLGFTNWAMKAAKAKG